MKPETEQKIRNMSISEIREQLAQGVFGFGNSPDPRNYNLANTILQEKIEQRDMDLAERNLKSTRNLVWATWGLVLVTFSLVLITSLKK